MKTNPVIITNDLTRRFADILAVDHLTLDAYTGSARLTGPQRRGEGHNVIQNTGYRELVAGACNDRMRTGNPLQVGGQDGADAPHCAGALAVLLALTTAVVALA